VTDSTPITRLYEERQALDDDALAEFYAPPPPPWLRVNFVSSVDGAVEVGGRSAGLSSPADQRVLSLLRTECDALMIGAGTLRVEQYGPMQLTAADSDRRREHGLAAQPTLVVVSGSLDLDPHQPAFAEAPVRPIVLTQANAPEARRAALAATTDVLTAGEHRVDLAAAIAALHDRGLGQILCEGGPHLLGGLIAADLVDELCLTVSPLLAGSGPDRITAGEASPLRRMVLHQVLTADGSLLLRYRRAAAGTT
jgi:riboflavin biosynthesis pyrimidine reductase